MTFIVVTQKKKCNNKAIPPLAKDAREGVKRKPRPFSVLQPAEGERKEEGGGGCIASLLVV